MGRFLYIIIALIILCALASPWVNGMMFQRNYLNLINNINARQDKVQINVLRYDKGYLSSKARLEVVLKEDKITDQSKIIIDQSISHGPITHSLIGNKYIVGLASIASFFHYPDEKKLFGVQNDQGFMQVDSRVSYAGRWENQAQSPTLSFNQPGMKISWRGLNGMINLSVNNTTDRIKAMDMDVTLGPFNVQGEQNPLIQSADVSPITIKNAIKRTEFDLWDGESNISMSAINISLMNGEKITASNFNLYSQANLVESSLYDRTWQMDLKSLVFPNKVVAEIAPITFILSMKNLSAQGLRDYMNFARTTDPTRLKAIDAPTVIKFVTGILTPTTTVDLSLSFDTSLGGFQAQANSKFLQPLSPSLGVLSMLQNLSQQIMIKADIRLVDKFFENYMGNISKVKQQTAKTNAIVTAAKDKTLVMEEMKQTVGKYLEQGKITLPMSLSIIGIMNQNLSPAMFNQQLDALNIPTDLNNQLKQEYQTAMASQELQTVQSLPPPSTATSGQEFLTSLVNQGYLLKDNNYYYASITIERGEMKLNGKEFNPLLAARGMGAGGPVMAVPGSVSGAPSVSVPPAIPGLAPATRPGADSFPAKAAVQGPVSQPARATSLTPASRPPELTAPAPSSEPGQATQAAPLSLTPLSTKPGTTTFPSPTSKPGKNTQPSPASMGPQF